MYKKLIAILIIGLIFRLVLVPSAYHGDLNNNISWGEELESRGIASFYGSPDASDWPYSAPNQPPLYLLIYGGLMRLYAFKYEVIKSINQKLSIFPSSIVWYWELEGKTLMVKLPGILADLGIGMLIFYYFNLKKKRELAMILTSVWVLNPLVWYNSSIWGQTDALVNLLGLIGILGLLGTFGRLKRLGKLSWFSFWFTLSVLYKPSLIILLPVLAVLIFKQKYKKSEFIKALLINISLIVLVSIWFHPQPDFPIWFINLWTTRILPGEIGYLSANAFNIWWLVDPGKTLDSSVYLGLPARMWGMIGFGLVYLSITYFVYKEKISDKRLFIALSLVSLGSFILMTRIHERYMYPFFVFGIFAMTEGLVWVLGYLILSISHLSNLYSEFWQPMFLNFKDIYNSSFTNFLSALNIFVFFVLYLHYILRDLLSGKIINKKSSTS